MLFGYCKLKVETVYMPLKAICFRLPNFIALYFDKLSKCLQRTRNLPLSIRISAPCRTASNLASLLIELSSCNNIKSL